MIKLFRKIRQDLLSKGNTGKPAYRTGRPAYRTGRQAYWTGRYLKYAIGEIILVMIGILLALQVNNWNENRLKQKKEYVLLTSINEEFKANKMQLEEVIFNHKRALESCKYLKSLFPIDVKVDNLDSIGKHLFHSTITWTFNPSQGSINGMINTSSFELIRNDELRQILLSWQDLLMDFQEGELEGKNIVSNKMDPFFSMYFDVFLKLKDPRNNLAMLETLNFEYIIGLRFMNLLDIVNGGELQNLERNIDRIIELTTFE
jgi:hypothetical protein